MKRPKTPKVMWGYPRLETLNENEGFLVRGDPIGIASSVQSHASLMGKFLERKFTTKSMQTRPQRGIFVTRSERMAKQENVGACHRIWSSGALYVILRTGQRKPVTQRSFRYREMQFVVDYDESGNVLGIEILDLK